MSDSKTGSKDNLNESTMPLLESDTSEKSGETPEKMVIELEVEEKAEKDDTGTEKTEPKEKVKKEKKPKVKKEKGPSCIDTRSTGLDLAARDGRGINTEIDLDFDDVLAEPLAAHGLDPVWRLSFILFSETKLWVYRLSAALLALPLSLIWGLLFAILTATHVWITRPTLRVIELLLAVFKRFWVSLLAATLLPLCDALGAVFGRVSVKSSSPV